MTVEEKALALVNGIVVAERKLPSYLVCDRRNDSRWEALCRAIEAHEADKKAFSDAVAGWVKADRKGADARRAASEYLLTFILPDPEPDPLVEAVTVTIRGKGDHRVRLDELARLIRGGARIERIEQ